MKNHISFCVNNSKRLTFCFVNELQDVLRFLNSTKWKFNNDGSGQIANGNISWNAAGAVTFSSAVSLNWTDAIEKIQIGGNNLLNNSGDWRAAGWNGGYTTNGLVCDFQWEAYTKN